MSDTQELEPVDVGMPILPSGYCPPNFRPCTDVPERDTEVLVLHAWLEDNGDARTGRPVRWFRYVSRWNGYWDEPDWMRDKPSAAWFGDDHELADGPSFWQPLPPLPEDLPVAAATDEA